MSTTSTLEFLEEFPLFNGLETHESKYLASQMEKKVFSCYSHIYLQGEASAEVYFLDKGTIKIGNNSEDGKEVIKSLIHPKAMFGELGLIGEKYRKDFAQALKEEVHLYVIKVETLKYLMKNSFTLCSNIMNLFGSRLMRAETKLESLVFKDARARIIDFIKDSISDRGRKVGMEMLLKHSLTHQDIANITCTSRQTVTLVLNELRNENLIYFNRGKILVRDLEAL